MANKAKREARLRAQIARSGHESGEGGSDYSVGAAKANGAQRKLDRLRRGHSSREQAHSS